MSDWFTTLPPVYWTQAIRTIESRAQLDTVQPPLMERAGLAAAELARDLVAGSRKPVLLFAGPGNNGGDAFVVARHLKQWWHRVVVVFAGDAANLPADAHEALEAWVAAGGSTVPTPPDHPGGFGLIVDGLFGIGLHRELTGLYADWVQRINQLQIPVLALDIPSGLHADNGRILGCAVRAHRTVTFIALKPGLLTLDGPDHCGEVSVCDLGLPVEALLATHGRLLSGSVSAQVLPRRALNSHKGSFGNAGIIGGAPGMTGAALLAGRAAIKLGSGRVYLGLLDDATPRIDPLQPELMLRAADQVLGMDNLSCLAIGPGLSQSAAASACVARALQTDTALVIDADALNLIGAQADLQALCRQRSAPTIMTPHPAEAARLRQTSTAEIQADRVAQAVALAQQFRAVVALKGVGTILATADERVFINNTGNPGMASAGMGDVLSGLLAALVAQGAEPLLAACAAVHLHGAAADQLRDETGGPIGLTASETIEHARRLLNAAIY